MPASVTSSVAFVWENFGPYHIDRLEAVARELSGRYRVVGIEIGGSSVAYEWKKVDVIEGAERITLFPTVSRRSVPVRRLIKRLLRACLDSRASHIFLCNYNRFEILAVAAVLRCLGRRVYMMNESKFDDKQRVLWRELLKTTYCLPYHAVIVGGWRSADYFRLLGFKSRQIYFGYDTVSVDRIRADAQSLPAPKGRAFECRHFTIVARLIAKKNITMALEAYRKYCELTGGAARELYLCGSGEDEILLRREAASLGDKIKFCGFIQAPEVARVLASTLALILPSTEEQWGLVVNEAIAMGLPVLCSTNVGARDLLVRSGINGFIFETDNPSGLAQFMYQLGNDEDLWSRQCEGSNRLAPLADTVQFADAVTRMIAGQNDGEAVRDALTSR